MAFELPDLDTKDSAGLQAALIRRIPQFTTEWTDFNDSDPGITLLQLLCWISESLLYQTNAIPIQTQQNFLRQVLGLAFSSNVTPYSQNAQQQYDFAFEALRSVLAQMENGQALSKAQLQQAVLNFLNAPYLALSLQDVDKLAMETNLMLLAQQAQSGKPPALLVQRADSLVRDSATRLYILSSAKWAYRLPSYPNTLPPDAAGGLRRVLVYQAPNGSAAQTAKQNEANLLAQVNYYLRPRVLLGSRVDVAAAQLTAINIGAAVTCPAHVDLGTVLDAMMSSVFTYFLPTDRWAYNQAPLAANVQLLLERVPGVASVERLTLAFVPTVRLADFAQLGVNAVLADLPPGPAALVYRGLPRLRCLSLYARHAA
ncbi:hypothetical protein FNU76_17505 [Chitinimonas arctica]|uniref:Baseplate protein J-like domain-containing protein n=1 Tax=Chitinimonas arctica TaxID=2594795 RepID=A0A516SIM1_9NEIS|nr:hypothetical protein [Chitinimonas arctica]QDQ27997.1 hypothetical protein FNU76_17505 [Chitinimonas arctica]